MKPGAAGRVTAVRVRRMPARTVVGVVSDTHGLLRPEALRRLRGVDRIVHAGDIGSAEVLRASGQYGPKVPVPDDADVQTRLLGFIGRNPLARA